MTRRLTWAAAAVGLGIVAGLVIAGGVGHDRPVATLTLTDSSCQPSDQGIGLRLGEPEFDAFGQVPWTSRTLLVDGIAPACAGHDYLLSAADGSTWSPIRSGTITSTSLELLVPALQGDGVPAYSLTISAPGTGAPAA